MPDDTAWAARVAADRRCLDERLDAEQREVLDEVASMFGASDPSDLLGLDFIVVFGSYARGEATHDSDLDIYLEAANLKKPTNRADAGRQYQVFAMPRGTLDADLRRGSDFAQGIVRDGLVVYDAGLFRWITEDVEGRENPT